MKEQKKITFANLPSQAQIDGIKINIYDISGKKLKTLDGDDIDYGNKIYWDGRSDKNQRLASGIYIARIECSGSAKNEKIAIL
jgi:flagellar hook assembly protein FlgD